MEKAMETFNDTDAILFDNIRDTLKQYISNNGSEQLASEALMESYEGYPDMIRALVDWSNLYGNGTANLDSATEMVLLDNEATLVSRLDDVLNSSDAAQPFITAVTSSEHWQPVVSAMAARTRESTLHNLLTRETRLAQAGISQGALQDPQSFLTAIMSQFNDLLSKGNPVSDEELTSLYRRVAAMSTYDECTTIVALRLFHTLSKEAEDPFMRGLYRRVGQEVRREAVDVMSAANIVSETTASQFVTRLAILTDTVSSDVVMKKPIVDALLSLLANDRTSRRRFEPETRVLQDCYGGLIGDIGIKDGDLEVVESVIESNYSIQEKVLLIRTLCHVEIFEEVLQALYSHEHRTYLDGKPDRGKRRCLCLLLAYAGVFICLDERELPELLMNEQSKAHLRGELKILFERLEQTSAICEDLKPGCPRFKIKGKVVEVLLQGVKDPLIARGILMWAREGLHGGTDLRALLATGPKHLAFLEAIAQNHVILRGKVLNVIREAFMREYPGLDMVQIEELRDKLMKTVAGLVRIQMAPQIVQDFRTSWADDRKVDLAHLRRFVQNLLQMISPPYSPAFATSLLELLANKRVAGAVDKDVKTARLVFNFRKQADDMRLKKP